MNQRRVLVATLVIALFGGAVAAGRNQQTPLRATFGQSPAASRPFLPLAKTITTTWYCPGVPAQDDTFGGQVVVSNPSESQLQGRLTLFGSDGVAPVLKDLNILARSSLSIEIRPLMSANFVSAMVELDSGSGIVEQRAVHPGGNAIATCTPATSRAWYFADGFTVDGSADQIVLTNPYPDVAIVDLSFFKKDQPMISPAAFQDYPIAGHSVKVISLADIGGKDEVSLAVQVVASRGRFLAGRSQHYFGGGRLGYSMALGAPRLAEQLYFAEGETGPGITETYAIFNPTKEDVLLEPTVLGVPLTGELVDPDAIPVPSNSVVTFDATGIVGMPVGQHTMVFSTLAQASVVIERVLTKMVDNKPMTSVVQGMTPEYVVSRWYVPIGVDGPTDNALVIYNVDGVDTTVAVKAIGPGGEVAVPGLEAIPLISSGVITVSLSDSSAFGRTLVVESAQRLLVERLVRTGSKSDRRAGVWAVPECGPCNLLSLPSS